MINILKKIFTLKREGQNPMPNYLKNKRRPKAPPNPPAKRVK